MRAASRPRPAMKRAVLPERDEKYTSPATGSGQLADQVGAEARPVILARDHDRRLPIAERRDAAHGVVVLGQVDQLVIETTCLECARGGRALHTGRPGI